MIVSVGVLLIGPLECPCFVAAAVFTVHRSDAPSCGHTRNFQKEEGVSFSEWEVPPSLPHSHPPTHLWKSCCTAVLEEGGYILAMIAVRSVDMERFVSSSPSQSLPPSLGLCMADCCVMLTRILTPLWPVMTTCVPGVLVSWGAAPCVLIF